MNVILSEGNELFQITVSSIKAGHIVGKAGEFIQIINQTTGAHVEFNTGVPDNGQTKSFLISGNYYKVSIIIF